jgi:transcription antitermination factor NusG
LGAEPDGSQLAAILPAPRQWYVLRVEPHSEKKVEERSADLGVETFCPRGMRIVNERHVIRMPIFPGYVFVGFPPMRSDLFHLFARDRGFRDRPDVLPADIELGETVAMRARPTVPPVTGSIGFLSRPDSGMPVCVDSAVIVELRAREANGEFDEQERVGRWYLPRWLRKARYVDIDQGPFAGRSGFAIRVVNRKMIRVWVQDRGRANGYPIDVPIDWVKRHHRS